MMIMAMKNAKQKQKKEMQNIENAKIKTAMLGAYTTKSKKNQHCHWAPKCCPHNRDTVTLHLPLHTWATCRLIIHLIFLRCC